MILYHGSNVVVDKPRIIQANRYLDFGNGFYTTTNLEQAVNFAKKVADRRKEGDATVNRYQLSAKVLTECKVLRFEKPDELWLDYVTANRLGQYHGEDYDLVYGPVANDDVYRTITLFMTGVLSREQTLEALKIKKLFDQLVFTSEKALLYLHFEGSERV